MGPPISRALLFLVLAGALTTYAFWIYLRVELAVPAARRLAIVRAVTLVLVLLLLFDPRLPTNGPGGDSGRWVLLDASLSMTAAATDGRTPADVAAARAADLQGDGWTVVRFGDRERCSRCPTLKLRGATGLVSELAPALQTVAEAGAREVRVLSDLRFTDGVAIQATVEALPIAVEFEDLSQTTSNAGIARFSVTDVLQPDESPSAEIEVFGGFPVIRSPWRSSKKTSSSRASLPWRRPPGLRATTSVDLPVAAESGRRRYRAQITGRAEASDGFPSDDEAVTYANIGYQAGALVLVSAVPDWEPRYLLPVLEDVTGLPSVGYLRVGPDRFVRLGSASERGLPVDSATVRRAAADAALLVLHGLGRDVDPWMTAIAGRPGRRLVLPSNADGAAAVGLQTAEPAAGEWYASPDVPTSPIAGALAGVDLQGLPPLSGVMVPEVRSSLPPLNVQLRGAGAPESAFGLVDRADGRIAVALASEFWRWAMREQGREPYRRVWSGVVGWLLADEQVAAAEPRPSQWVVARGDDVSWSLAGDSTALQLLVRNEDGIVTDTTVAGGGSATTDPLEAGPYDYAVVDPEGDTVSTGRFDVAAGISRDAPGRRSSGVSPCRHPDSAASAMTRDGPIRTSPWPYLLLIMLLCGEWIVRRRSGLR